MGLVGAFAGGVGGVAFNGLQNLSRIAALTAIGATAGAAGSAIMGGNIGLGAAAGAAGGFLGGAVGGRLADKWNPGLARTMAGMATAAGTGAASAAIAGGSPGMGAGLGAFAVAAAIAAKNFQAALDAARAGQGVQADAEISDRQRQWQLSEKIEGRAELGYRLGGWKTGLRAALDVDSTKIQFQSVEFDLSRQHMAAEEFIAWNEAIDEYTGGVRLPYPFNVVNTLRKFLSAYVKWGHENTENRE